MENTECNSTTTDIHQCRKQEFSYLKKMSDLAQILMRILKSYLNAIISENYIKIPKPQIWPLIFIIRRKASSKNLPKDDYLNLHHFFAHLASVSIASAVHSDKILILLFSVSLCPAFRVRIQRISVTCLRNRGGRNSKRRSMTLIKTYRKSWTRSTYMQTHTYI